VEEAVATLERAQQLRQGLPASWRAPVRKKKEDTFGRVQDSQGTVHRAVSSRRASIRPKFRSTRSSLDYIVFTLAINRLI